MSLTFTPPEKRELDFDTEMKNFHSFAGTEPLPRGPEGLIHGLSVTRKGREHPPDWTFCFRNEDREGGFVAAMSLLGYDAYRCYWKDENQIVRDWIERGVNVCVI